jgi:hypothetical protein
MDIRIASALIALFIPLAVAAQDVSVPQPVTESAQSPEEIVIVGQRSILQLRLQMLDAEKLAYDVFNGFNDDRRFKISCAQQQGAGSYIRNQVCQPEFIIEVQAQSARAFMDSRSHFVIHNSAQNPGAPPPAEVPATPLHTEALIAARQRAFQRKMREVAEEHPEFLDAMVHYSEARNAYQQAVGTAKTSGDTE